MALEKPPWKLPRWAAHPFVLLAQTERKDIVCSAPQSIVNKLYARFIVPVAGEMSPCCIADPLFFEYTRHCIFFVLLFLLLLHFMCLI